MQTLLVVDDEERILVLMMRTFSGQGYRVLTATNSASAFAQLGTHPVDLMILDLALGEETGLTLLEKVRPAYPKMPVIVVSGITDVGVRIKTLDSGAIDVVAKPFVLAELVARVRRHLGPTEAPSSRYVDAGRHRLDISRRVFHGPEGSSGLAEREAALLAYLMRRAGDVCTREELLKFVWELDFDPGTNLVDVSIRRLRRKLPGVQLETVRGVGYCFLPDDRPA
ncbi:MAG TPA: response regulator transcription factor [Dermatophilaceae bacterium]|nr:response regulator transcription factor [Dermatophilaceae bacterium]